MQSIEKAIVHIHALSQNLLVMLSRDDKKVISSLSRQIAKAQALTEKQQDLALRLCTKYKKQVFANSDPLTKHQFDQCLQLPVFELGTRILGHSNTILYDPQSNSIQVDFVRNPWIFSWFWDTRSSSKGHWSYDNITKKWIIRATEENLRMIYDQLAVDSNNDQFDLMNHFEMNENARHLFTQVSEALQKINSIPNPFLQSMERDVSNCDQLMSFINEMTPHANVLVYGTELGTTLPRVLLMSKLYDSSFNVYEAETAPQITRMIDEGKVTEFECIFVPKAIYSNSSSHGLHNIRVGSFAYVVQNHTHFVVKY